jgi:hypothetical protein
MEGAVMDTWILQSIKARSTRRVVAWAAALALVGLVGVWQSRYLLNFLGGPYELAPGELDSIGAVSEAPRYFARVTGSEALDTGMQQITVTTRNGVETGRSVSANYYALVVGDRLLVCKSRSGPRTTFEGSLLPMPGDVEAQLFQTPDMQGIRHRFYPFYLDDESFRVPGYWALGGLLVFAFVLLKHGRPDWRHMKHPATHPLAERVQTWGDPIGVAVAARREARSPRVKGRNGWALTDQFLMRSTFFTFDLLRLSDLLWAYKKVTKHSVNFIPTGKTYQAVLACYGGAATVQGNEKTVDDVLTFASERTPWAVFGFTKELESCFSGSTDEFCAAVEERKREWSKAAAAPPGAA